jgi:HKD family nuclease
MDLIHQPSGTPRLGDFLIENFQRDWSQFRAAVAFVKRSGTRHIVEELSQFAQRSRADMIIGIDHLGTSCEGLEDLLGAVAPSGRITIFHNAIASTFHPKLYLFRSEDEAEVLIGSGNLTEGGLFTNYEASLRLTLDLREGDDRDLLAEIESLLDGWSDTTTGTAHKLDAAFLAKLVANGYVPVEAMAAAEGAESRRERGSSATSGFSEDPPKPVLERLFLGRSIPSAPRRAVSSGRSSTRSSSASPTPVAAIPPGSNVRGFVMTLQQTDAGVGQTTRGASRRSPELFIPLAARDMQPQFWGWPNDFVQDRAKPGKFDRVGVSMDVGGQIVMVNMMTWPDKHDFRLRSEALRSGGSVGSIIVIEKLDGPIGSAEYLVQFVPPGASLYPVYLDLCNQPVRNSQKRFGYY